MLTTAWQKLEHRLQHTKQRITADLEARQLILVALVALLTIALVILMFMYLPQAVDWHYAFRPAASVPSS